MRVNTVYETGDVQVDKEASLLLTTNARIHSRNKKNPQCLLRPADAEGAKAAVLFGYLAWCSQKSLKWRVVFYAPQKSMPTLLLLVFSSSRLSAVIIAFPRPLPRERLALQITPFYNRRRALRPPPTPRSTVVVSMYTKARS